NNNCSAWIMTIASSGISKVLSERDHNIQEHARNHAHLTNCIHLKNHMHMHKTKAMLDKQYSGESSLMKDLTTIQRSRSLRDPSTSPSWNSPIIGSVMRRLEKEGAINVDNLQGIKPLVGDHRKELRRAVTASPLSQSDTSRKTTTIVGGFSVKDSAEDDKRLRRRRKIIGYALADSRLRRRDLKSKGRRKGMGDEKWRSDSELGRKPKINDMNRKARPLNDGCYLEGKVESSTDLSTLPQTHVITDTKDNKESMSKSFSGRLKNNIVKSPEVYSPYSLQDRNDVRKGIIHNGEVETDSVMDSRDHSASHFNSHFHSHIPVSGVKKPKKHKLKATERSHFYSPKELRQHHESPYPSVALNSVRYGGISTKDFPDSQRASVQTGIGKSAVINVPKKGCGIPWNWSRIHDRGKSILDMAGRSLSCGLSDSTTRKVEGLASQSYSSSPRELSAALETSGDSSSSFDSDSESLPLLIEPNGSQRSAETDAQGEKLSGELGLYADHQISVRQNNDMDSKTRLTGNIGHVRNIKGRNFFEHEARNHSLPRKYVPRTFKDLIGQNLATQALMNAILKEKIAPVYVFHGPHGTGKTSCARIFAAAMNCHSVEQSRPCGLCRSCLAHSLGKSSHIKEISGIGTLGFDCFQSFLDKLVMHPQSSHYEVFIVDDCDILTSDDWNSFSKVLDEAPWNVVLILITSRLDHLPHAILSRCQKFLFPKLKEIDIVNKLQMIASQEDLEIDNEALNLIASRSNGSMRDAEMTLDQLSLLGQRISLSLVQELVGLIPDEKLVDLLDLALSADTVNTVKSLRELMEAGVEPLALMSQLATLITDILAGSYKLHKERHKRLFFHKQTLSKGEMIRLRHALRTLSEAEKQLLLSNDRTTWLTAALLQLAPDPPRKFPSSSSGTSVIQSPVAYAREKEKFDREAMGIIRNNLDKHSRPMQYAKGFPMVETGGSGLRERIPTKTSRESDSANHVGSMANIQSSSIAAVRKNIPSSEHIMDIETNGTGSRHVTPRAHSDEEQLENAWVQEAHSSPFTPMRGQTCSETYMNAREHPQSQSILNSKSTRGCVIEQSQKSTDGSSQNLEHNNIHGSSEENSGRNQGTNILTFISQEGVSIAEKIEEENLRLESKSRGLLCWKAPKVNNGK
ncbi:hypothetical protein KI387_008489, partial [Taxus chinensis]